MARANLAIGADLQASFTGAQEDKSIRWIEAKVEGEAVILGNIGTTGTSVHVLLYMLKCRIPTTWGVFFPMFSAVQFAYM